VVAGNIMSVWRDRMRRGWIFCNPVSPIRAPEVRDTLPALDTLLLCIVHARYRYTGHKLAKCARIRKNGHKPSTFAFGSTSGTHTGLRKAAIMRFAASGLRRRVMARFAPENADSE
jgi:hypothetical protein